MGIFLKLAEQAKLKSGHGLCQEIFDDVDISDEEVMIFDLMSPTVSDKHDLIDANQSALFWGSDKISWKSGVMTDLRRTILLLCATINDEL